MKKSLLLIVFLAAASIASAQKTFSFGPKIGFNVSDIGTTSDDNGDEFSSENISGAKIAKAVLNMLQYTRIQTDFTDSTNGGFACPSR